MRLAIGLLILLIVAAAGARLARDYVRQHPQDVPWTSLDLGHPIGRFTRSKLVRLGDDPRLCRTLLARAGSRDLAMPERRASPQCGYGDGMRLSPDGTGDVAFEPSGIVTSCPVAAALLLWDDRVIQPAARRHFGIGVRSVEHAGSYSCRRLYGRDEGPFSEHATADAIDIIGFRLTDGRRISVLDDWRRGTAESAFLGEVRDGACDLFATVLSPDYNAAHRDHLHLDQADRPAGWHMCR